MNLETRALRALQLVALAAVVAGGCGDDSAGNGDTGTATSGAAAAPVAGAAAGAAPAATAGTTAGSAPAPTAGASPGAAPGGEGGSGGATGVEAGMGGTGGTAAPPTTAGACQREIGACTAPEVRVTEIDVGVAVTPYGSEWDTLPLPMAIAAMPSGGSRLTWLGTDGYAYVAELDCNDQIVGSPIRFPANDVQDIHADDSGGVLLLTRPASGSGEHGCGPGMLCGGTSAPCFDMYLVRFAADGTEQWATPVTNLSDSLTGYDDGARFVWGHYQHHGRIAFDGDNYAAYFCIGITVDNAACVDIHEGDRMQVVSSAGAPVDHPDAFQVGCSHSWTTRIVWDPRSSEFVTVCATDRPTASSPCQIARSPGYQTLAPVQCAGQFWGGDLVLASGGGYWTAYTQEGAINLVHFTDSGPDQTIDGAGSADHAKLVSYGEGRMLLAWESGASMAAQVLDDRSGAPMGAELAIDVPDHDYQGFAAYDDGSAAYAAAGTSDTSIRVARVMPCE